MWSVWRVTGRDPYCIWNELDPLYRPLYVGDGTPVPPAYPDRVEAVIYAMARYSFEIEVRLAGGKTQGR